MNEIICAHRNWIKSERKALLGHDDNSGIFLCEVAISAHGSVLLGDYFSLSKP